MKGKEDRKMGKGRRSGRGKGKEETRFFGGIFCLVSFSIFLSLELRF